MSTPDLRLRPALAPAVRLQKDPITSEPVLLFPEGLLILNPTAHEIVARCDGTATIETIVSALAEEYDVRPDRLSQDVQVCLEDLRARKLIVLSR